MNFRKKLPSLIALVALEATIRHRSVTAAARELGVTQAAVSRQIAALEDYFERPLFARRHRMLEPTSACLTLGSALREGFYNIVDAVEVMRSTAKDVVTIGSNIGLSSFWLLPKVAEFCREHPGIRIRIISQDGNLALAAGDVDIAIHFGIPPFRNGIILASCRDLTFPVCSPNYAAAHDLSVFPNGGCDLIETDIPVRSWLDWADWLSETGRGPHRIEPALRFSYYTETIAAASAGQGVALGWHMLIRPHLEDGRLVRVGDAELVPKATYNLVVPTSVKCSANAGRVADWLADALQPE